MIPMSGERCLEYAAQYEGNVSFLSSMKYSPSSYGPNGKAILAAIRKLSYSF